MPLLWRKQAPVSCGEIQLKARPEPDIIKKTGEKAASMKRYMHIGSYDEEPKTVALMHEYMEQQGYALDITDQRLHHEIYLSDARKVAPEKLKTVIRHPIRRNWKLPE